MNILLLAIAIASLIWSIFYDNFVLITFISLIIIYIITTTIFLKDNNTTIFQKLRIAEYQDSGDPTAFAKLDIPLDDIDKYLAEYNKKNPLKKITYSHIGLKAMGLALKEIQGCGKHSFGNFIEAEDEELSSSLIVNIENKNIMNLTVRDCYNSSLKEIAAQMKGKVGKMKKNKDPTVKRQMKLVRLLPSFIVHFLILFSGFMSYNLGLDFKPFKIKRHNFGFGVITNVTGFDVSDVIPAHINLLRDVLVMIISNPVVKPFAENGKIVKRKVVKVNLAFDPRFGKGECFFNAINKVKEVWTDPFKYLE